MSKNLITSVISQRFSFFESDIIPFFDDIFVYYKLDETTGDAIDESNNELNGTVFNMTRDVDGIKGTAYEFNGTDSYVDISNTTPITSPMTVSAWVYTGDDIDSNQMIWNYGGTSSITYLQISSNNLRFIVNNTVDGITEFNCQPNTWYHVVGVYDKDAASDRVRMYVNGVLVDTTDYSNEINNTDTDDMRIGRRIGTGSLYYQGIIDEVGVWNIAMTDAQVQELHTYYTKLYYFVVAGGGGGGRNLGGGGGAGGVQQGFFDVSLNTTYPIEVGEGGVGAISGVQQSAQGENSIFHIFEAIGGGRGGNFNGSGGDGASGGGGANVGGSGGNGILGQGNDGSDGNTNTGNSRAGGGGGGADGAGIGGGNPGPRPNGGQGVPTFISGTEEFYAGGGGGGADSTPGGGFGGQGGGGRGGTSSSNTAQTSGQPNTGGGGAGGGRDQAPGSDGGSGIIILRYLNTYSIDIVSGNLSYSTNTYGDFKVTSFTSGSGNIKFNID